MVKIFVTGVTGYIGGDAVFALAAAHPEYEITASVRTEKSGAPVEKKHPNIRLVIADLDSAEVLCEEASNADVVINFADADHQPALEALIQGIQQRPDSAGPGYLIHTSGTGLLLYDDIVAERFGEPSDKIYDDWDGVSAVTSFADGAPHRHTDKLVLGAGVGAGAAKIRTAVVAPPAIYGPGRGPGNTRSIQAYNLSREILRRGRGFKVGRGLARWSEVHVHDLSALYVRLVEAAVAGKDDRAKGHALWGPEAYYFAENGDFAWGDISTKIAEVANSLGLIATAEVDELSSAEVESIMRWGTGLWGMNSQSKAIRAKKLLGWTPKGNSLLEELPAIVETEAKSLNAA